MKILGLIIIPTTDQTLNNNTVPTRSSCTCNAAFCQFKGDTYCNDMFISQVYSTTSECNVKTDSCTCLRLARPTKPDNYQKSVVYKPPRDLIGVQ